MKPVVKRESETVERLLTRFRHKVKKAGILDDYRKKRHYTKPSDRKRLQHTLAVKKQRRLQKYAEME